MTFKSVKSIILKSSRCVFVCLSVQAVGAGGGLGGSEGGGGPRGVRGGGAEGVREVVLLGSAKGLLRRNAEGGRRLPD